MKYLNLVESYIAFLFNYLFSCFNSSNYSNALNISSRSRSSLKNEFKSINLSCGSDRNDSFISKALKNLSLDSCTSSSSRWSNISVENLHKDTQRCLKTHIADLKKLKPHQKSSRNVTIRKMLRCAAKEKLEYKSRTSTNIDL